MIKKIKKGFTLVELVVVIAVIAILAAVSVVAYIGITRKAQESNDHMVIDQVNTALTNSQILTKKFTVHEIVERFEAEEGYDVRTMKPELEGTQFVYSYEKGMFGYWKTSEEKVIYPKDLENLTNTNDLWFFDEEVKEEYDDVYSHYINLPSTTISDITSKSGIDVGKCSGINSITLDRSGLSHADKNIVIRTNSNLTTLTVKAPNDKVYHYDSVGDVNIISSDMASYHENGDVSFLEIAGGHIVLESTAKVSAVHFTATNGEFKNSDNKTISIDLSKVSEENKPSFTRDPVSIGNNGTYVAEVTTDKTEYVWLFGNGIKEQMVATEQQGAIAENGELKEGIVPGASDGSVAEEIANPAKRNSEGALVDNSGNVIDVTEVDWTSSDALGEIEDIVYEEPKSKEDAINENVSTLITTDQELYEYITGEVVNGVIGNNITITRIMELGSDKVLDLNGFTLSSSLSTGRPFVFSNSQSMTVNANGGGMKIISTSSYGLFRIQSPGVNLVLNGGTYEGYLQEAPAIIWVGNNGSNLTYSVNIELNDVTAYCIGQFVRDTSCAGHSAYDAYRSAGVLANKLTVTGGNYTFNNAGINVNGSIDGFVLQYVDVVFDGVKITSSIGKTMELDGGNGTYRNNEFLCENSNSIQGWNGTVIGISYDAVITVESGKYTGYYGLSVLTHGGHIILKGGEVSGTSGDAIILYDGSEGQIPVFDIYGGTVNGEVHLNGTTGVVHDYR